MEGWFHCGVGGQLHHSHVLILGQRRGEGKVFTLCSGAVCACRSPGSARSSSIGAGRSVCRKEGRFGVALRTTQKFYLKEKLKLKLSLCVESILAVFHVLEYIAWELGNPCSFICAGSPHQNWILKNPVLDTYTKTKKPTVFSRVV